MIKGFKDFFQKQASLDVDKSGSLTSLTLRVATAALLLEMANIDYEYVPEENSAILKALEHEFKLEEGEPQKLLEMAQAFLKGTGQLDELIEAINEYFSVEQRQQLVTLAWRVARADGRIRPMEEVFASRLQGKLSLTEEQWARALKTAGKTST